MKRGRNLKKYHFKPGQSGNPGGRRKGDHLTAWLRRVGEEKVDGKTNDEHIARVVVKHSKKGDMTAINFYAERTEGKVKDVLKLETESKMPSVSDEELAVRLKRSQTPNGNQR